MTLRKRKLKFLLLVLVVLPLALVVTQSIRIKCLSRRMNYISTPFERELADAQMNILFLGDSTAVGTGSPSPEQSTAGWLAQDFPKASIENISQNGLKLSGLRERLSQIQKKDYDLIVVQIGANDVIRLTPFDQIETDFQFIVEELSRRSQHIIILHSGDIGTAPIFIWPFNYILSQRSYQLRQLYKDLSQHYNFRYVDLIAAKIDRQFSADLQKYYAPDRLHLSGQGYYIWYKAIRSEMEHFGFKGMETN